MRKLRLAQELVAPSVINIKEPNTIARLRKSAGNGQSDALSGTRHKRCLHFTLLLGQHSPLNVSWLHYKWLKHGRKTAQFVLSSTRERLDTG
jgi:hypothetical protein